MHNTEKIRVLRNKSCGIHRENILHVFGISDEKETQVWNVLNSTNIQIFKYLI